MSTKSKKRKSELLVKREKEKGNRGMVGVKREGRRRETRERKSDREGVRRRYRKREEEREGGREERGVRVTPAASRRVTQSSGHGSEEAREEAVSSQLPFYAATVASAA